MGWSSAAPATSSRRRKPTSACTHRHHARHAPEGSPPGVALQGRHQLHAVFFSAGGCRLQLFVRPECRRVAPHRRRPDLGGVSVRRCRRPEPNLGPRDPQPSARRLPRLAAPANSLFLAKAIGNFVFVGVLECLMTPLFVMFYRLRPLGPTWQLLIVAVLGTWALVVNGTFFAAMSLDRK